MSFSLSEIYKAVNRLHRGAKQATKDARQKAQWVWESIQGDFNPNRSFGQVGFDTGVSLIPGVDTVFDIRDIIANVIAIVRAPTSGMAWFSLVLSIIGLIPELGSVAKGVVKLVLVKLRPLIKNADDLTNASKMVKHLDDAFDAALPEIVRYLQHPKVQQFLTKAGVTDVIKWVAESVKKVGGLINTAKLKSVFDEAAGEIKTILQVLRPLLPDAAGPKIKQVLDGIVYVQREFSNAVDRYMEPIRQMMLRLADRLDELHWVAYSQQLNKGWIAPLSEQGARRLIAKHRPAWVKTAVPVRFKQLDPDDFRIGTVYTRGLKSGAPALDDDAIKSFAKGIKARPLRDGETLYRVLDPSSGSLSTCWIPESVWKEIVADPAKAREVWRGQLAVKPEWNQNGTYVKYTYNKARDGDITVWEGPTAMQWLGREGKHEEGFLEGGLTQIVFNPKQQMRDAKPDEFARTQFPDMVEGNLIRKADGEAKPTYLRTKIQDPRVEGPFETGWGFKDFGDQHDLIGLPNPMKE